MDTLLIMFIFSQRGAATHVRLVVGNTADVNKKGWGWGV